MKIPVFVLACLVCGSAFAEADQPIPSLGSVEVGAQRAMDAAFGGLSAPAIALGTLLWAGVVTSATGTTGTTGTQ
jgi:hypothetical protein